MINREVYSRIPLKQKKITLCGSTRFADAFEYWNTHLTLAGNTVYSVAVMSHHANENGYLSPEEKTILDEVHLQKIDNSDVIFVIDIGGYMGESTTKEVEYAKNNNKEIYFLSEFSTFNIEPEKISA